MGGVKCIINGGFGVYIPQHFAESFDGWKGISDEDKEILLAGPEHEYYWDAWEDILSSVSWTDEDGNIWFLYQDDDLFAVCEELMSDEEYLNFFGGELG